MKILAFAVLLLCASCLVRADDDSHVVVLTDANFDDSLKAGPILVEFYAPWCGHCKSLAPEWEKAATQLHEEGSTLRLGKVDCTVEKETASRFEIGGFPTIKLFKTHDGPAIEYRSDRKADAIVSWLKKKTGPTTQNLATKEELDTFSTAGEAAVVGFFSEDSAARKAFETAANDPNVENYAFGLVTDKELFAGANVQEGAVKLYRSFDAPLVFDGDLADFSSWLLAHAHPYLDDAPKSWSRFMARKLPVVLLFAETEEASFLPLQNWFGRIARERVSQFNFGSVGKQLHARLPQLGGSGEKIPTIVVINPTTGKNFPFDETKEFNADEVNAFLDGVASGAIKPLFKSEAIPETQDGPVTVLVGNNFESVVLESDNDVFVEFYAPWCGHCKHLAPIWDQLGEHYKSKNPKVVIAKLDSTVNDNPVINVRGFPTIYFFAAGKKDQPIEYQGGRTLEEMIEFIEENATNKTPGHVAQAPDAHADHDHDHDEL